MVQRTRLVAAGLAVAAPIISGALFVAALLTLPPLPYEVLLFSYGVLQLVLLLSAPIAAGLAMLLPRREPESGWRLLAARLVMPVVGLLLWLVAGTSVVILAGGAA
jgi:hypothetical protein